ncbi:MAG TPA: DUF1573 domain-containing protein [Bacteroidia bacterium]|nr:DUF1573 domain-containing protein [Bacteroidia bacterium]
MKKIIYALLFVAAAGTAVHAQSTTPAVPATSTPTGEVNNDPNAPEIVFETEVHDFGTIEYGGDGTYDFKFTNTGKSPLIISNARGSCGCTVPQWPKEPVAKGQSGVINVHYDTKRPGPFTKTVTISSNAKSATKVITIKGTVQPAEQSEGTMPVKKENTAAPLEKQ